MDENTGLWGAIIASISGFLGVFLKAFYDAYKNSNDNRTEIEKAKIEGWQKKYSELEEIFSLFKNDTSEREDEWRKRQLKLQSELNSMRLSLDKANRFMALALTIMKTTADQSDKAIVAVIQKMDMLYGQDIS
jgi:hypothetical protein